MHWVYVTKYNHWKKEVFRRNPYWVPFWEIMFDAVLRISLSYDIELICYTNNTLITKNKEKSSALLRWMWLLWCDLLSWNECYGSKNEGGFVVTPEKFMNTSWLRIWLDRDTIKYFSLLLDGRWCFKAHFECFI